MYPKNQLEYYPDKKEENKLYVKYEIPIFDILAVMVALLAVLVACISLYFSFQTVGNTSDTADNTNSSNVNLQDQTNEIIKIRLLLEEIKSLR